MIDTINNPLHRGIFELLIGGKSAKSSEIHSFIKKGLDQEVSLITIKRLLSKFVEESLVTIEGKGPATRYVLTPRGRVTAQVSAHDYCSKEPDVRAGFTNYQFDLFSSLSDDPFSSEELAILEKASANYKTASSSLSESLRQKELERFVIELSWKSSRIEGNTYTLLDTEKLLRHGEEAPGHTKDEATMILSHKSAFTYIYTHQEVFRNLTRAGIEEVHTLLTENLAIPRNIRSGAVGVIGSRYRPLDNAYQINEALEALLKAVARMPHGYAKALIALAGLSYIQPFEDGNKRTSRLVANAVLLAHDLSPLSYRSVGEEEYREATLAFYELNTLFPLKEIFKSQYLFATETYLVS